MTPIHRIPKVPWPAFLLLACIAGIAHAAAPAAASPRPGTWRAWLDSPGGELPFGLELRREGAAWRGFLLNPPERLPVPVVQQEGGDLVLDIPHYDSTLRATVQKDGTGMDGTWRKRRGATEWTELPFHARLGEARRFRPDPVTPEAKTGAAKGVLPARWAVQFKSESDPAVALLQVQPGGRLSGTFLTTTGDYRYLAGDLFGSHLRLSCFDGSHAFLFDAHIEQVPGGPALLRGDFYSGNAWHDTWEGRADPRAELPDTFALSTWHGKEGTLGAVSFPDLTGRRRTLTDPAFSGKARILQIFGSWCPNCNDEADLLVELDHRYRRRGLSILGLAFELTGDPARDTAQLQKFAAYHHVDYPLLLAGLSDKGEASRQLPFLDRLRAYPTTLFLSGDGRVRAIHTGFAGPATGAAHKRLRERFEQLIEEILAEKAG